MDALPIQEVGTVPGLPGVVTRTLSASVTNQEALREMMRLNLDALVVEDDQGRVKGVVERGQLLAKLLLALTKR
jgi:hypothetical protein